DAVCDRLQQHCLAGTRRSHNQTTLPLAHRRQQIHHAAADVLAHRLHLHPLLRIQRSQVVEQNLVAGLLGRLEIDRLDLHQRKVLLSLVRRTYVAADGVAGFQVELANLRGRNVDVVGTRQVVVIGGAKEAVAVGEDFENALGKDVAFFFALRLENFEDQVLLAESAGAGDFKGPRDAAEFSDVLFFEFCDGHESPAVSFRGRDLKQEGKETRSGVQELSYIREAVQAEDHTPAPGQRSAAVKRRDAVGAAESREVPDEEAARPLPGCSPGSGRAHRSSCPGAEYSAYAACGSLWK